MHVTQGLRRAAQIKPNGTATVYRNRRHTWRETEDRVARLAAGLLKLGLPSGGRAAILALMGEAVAGCRDECTVLITSGRALTGASS